MDVEILNGRRDIPSMSRLIRLRAFTRRDCLRTFPIWGDVYQLDLGKSSCLSEDSVSQSLYEVCAIEQCLA
jgi:hypothetical protein